jgi:hypothetical protein
LVYTYWTIFSQINLVPLFLIHLWRVFLDVGMVHIFEEVLFFYISARDRKDSLTCVSTSEMTVGQMGTFGLADK